VLPSHVVFPAIGGALVALGLSMACRWVPPNRWYGLRLPATRADHSVWYDANAACGRELVVLGVALLAVALALQRLAGLPDLGYVAACLGVLALGSLIVVQRGIRVAERLRRARPRGSARARADL
jgi:hypothetical protein